MATAQGWRTPIAPSVSWMAGCQRPLAGWDDLFSHHPPAKARTAHQSTNRKLPPHQMDDTFASRYRRMDAAWRQTFGASVRANGASFPVRAPAGVASAPEFWRGAGCSSPLARPSLCSGADEGNSPSLLPPTPWIFQVGRSEVSDAGANSQKASPNIPTNAPRQTRFRARADWCRNVCARSSDSSTIKLLFSEESSRPAKCGYSCCNRRKLLSRELICFWPPGSSAAIF